MTALFISDLHLTPQREDISGAFQLFLHETPRPGDSLYILGDLFEYWAGDDDADAAFNERMAQALAKNAARGVAQYFVHGNRDFLIGDSFAERARLSLLPDPYVFDLYGVKTVLMHGDTLCTDDTAYQTFRSHVRQDAWQQAFLARPLADRLAEIERLRTRSEAEKAGKSMAIMDVNEDAVLATLSNTHAHRMIHGHTHRPARHDYVLSGGASQRWVLPAWDEHAGYLRVDDNGARLIWID